MAPRILRDGSWYEPLSSHSIYEADYERSIRRYSADLFPGYVCVPFRATVESDAGNVQADLALVDDGYRGWTVVEVELEHHSLWAHVEPQMRKLSSGKYTRAHAEAIFTAAPSLNRERLGQLVENVYPDFLVIVPTETPEWRSAMRNLGVGLATIQVFMNSQNQRVLTYEGDRAPSRPANLVSQLKPVGGFLARAMRVSSPAALPATDELTLEYDGFVTIWRVVRTQRDTVLLPNGTLDVDARRTYRIMRQDNGDLLLERG